jgi:hypothetical protein
MRLRHRRSRRLPAAKLPTSEHPARIAIAVHDQAITFDGGQSLG